MRLHPALLAVLSLLSPVVLAEQVEVFKLAAQSVHTVPGAKVYDVDALRAITERLSAGLPSSPGVATEMARARFAAMSVADKAALQLAARVVGQAAHYRIVKVPAIVIDRRAVVYGVSDVALALTIYRRWHAGEAAR